MAAAAAVGRTGAGLEGTVSAGFLSSFESAGLAPAGLLSAGFVDSATATTSSFPPDPLRSA